MDGFAEPFVIVGAIALGDDDGGAGGQARAEADDCVDDRSGGADGGLGQLADELAVTRPSLSRELSRLQKEAVLRLEGKTVRVLDMTRFEEYL